MHTTVLSEHSPAPPHGHNSRERAKGGEETEGIKGERRRGERMKGEARVYGTVRQRELKKEISEREFHKLACCESRCHTTLNNQ